MNSDVIDCGNIRNRYVELLRKKYDVIVVTPNYVDTKIKNEDGFISLPYRNKGIDRYAERMGIYEDYLDSWARYCIEYLKNIVMKEDIIFATSGGELAGVKIANILKSKVKCKTILNFHDPINYTMVNGKRTGGKYRNLHISRDKLAKKYIQTADYIITSSDSYKKILENSYPEKRDYISNIYFGYIDEANVKRHDEKPHKNIKMIYAGSMGIPQKAESIMEMWGTAKNVTIEYIGNASRKVKKMAESYSNVRVIPSMRHDDLLKYMEMNADIGLVCLIGDEWGACVPSKIFDLINLEIPILGLLPDGDAQNLINNGYGLAAQLSDVSKNQENLAKLRNAEFYIKIVENMRCNKKYWHMDYLFKDVYTIIERVINNR